jgi:hypothetical protein
MPTVCFVTPLSLVDFVDPDPRINGSRYIMAGNISILTLAARLTELGYNVRILNLDQLFLQFLGEDSRRPGWRASGHIPDPAPTGCAPSRLQCSLPSAVLVPAIH